MPPAAAAAAEAQTATERDAAEAANRVANVLLVGGSGPAFLLFNYASSVSTCQPKATSLGTLYAVVTGGGSKGGEKGCGKGLNSSEACQEEGSKASSGAAEQQMSSLHLAAVARTGASQWRSCRAAGRAAIRRRRRCGAAAAAAGSGASIHRTPPAQPRRSSRRQNSSQQAPSLRQQHSTRRRQSAHQTPLQWRRGSRRRQSSRRKGRPRISNRRR